MGDCCNCNSEISRDGFGQLGRYLKALDPANAPVDDRSLEDLLVFAKRYANQIRFYDIPESNIPGEADASKISWREFFRRDIAVITASIALTDIAQIKKDYEELRAKLEEQPSHNVFGDLFDPILGIATKIDGWYSLAIPENPLYADLHLAVISNLKEQMQKIVAYEEGFKYVDSKHLLYLDYSGIKNRDVWGLDEIINADISIYQGIDTEEKIRNAALFVDDIFNAFYGFVNQLIINSDNYMQFALEQYPAHQPHMTLFITFLQLFHLAQEQMNAITQKMLDFYYRDVLHLTAKPAIPDKVHIVFELAKDVAAYAVTEGTGVKAGKDAAGIEQLYVTKDDLVVNQAKIKELKTIFIDKTVPGTEDESSLLQKIYVRPVANSKDGLGEKFAEPNSKWPTFGKGNIALSTSSNVCDSIALLDDTERNDIAKVGFAIASPQLFLQGGNRILLVKLNIENLTFFQTAKAFETQNPRQGFFNIILSGEKGWVEITDVLSQAEWDDLLISYTKPDGTIERIGVFNPTIKLADGTTRTKGAYFLDELNNSINLFLPVSEQAIVGFDPKLHAGHDYKTTNPVVKILINPSAVIAETDYESLINNISIYAKAGSINPSEQQQNEIKNSAFIDSLDEILTYHFDGIQSIIIQTESGLVEPGKPFDPFTAFPAKGKSFYIGSEEVFNKPLGHLAVNINKTQQPGFDLSRTGTYGVSVLHNKKWEPLTTENGDDFDQAHLTINILNQERPVNDGSPVVNPLTLPRTPIQHFKQWQPQTEKGFLQLQYAPSEAPSDMQGRQELAIGLEIKEISVSYESALTTLDPLIDQFFHIYPFGATEIYSQTSSFGKPNSPRSLVKSSSSDFSVLDDLKEGLLVDANNKLFPHFNYISPYAIYYNDTSASLAFRRTNYLLNEKLAAAFINSSNTSTAALMLRAKDAAFTSTNQYVGDIQEGQLYIGLEKLNPLQSISMLFQFAEGSAEDEDNAPPIINWSYLSYNEWKPLKAENIVSDGTYGFQTTGIIKIDIPADATSHNTIITDGLIWLLASVTENADRVPQLIDIVTQAAEAEFKNQGNDPSHFDNALPAASIGKLAVPVAEISKVQQPFSSFDGKHQEIGKEFYTRVSERLRHKGRAINARDYEHLVLERFPSIYKVKCITHTDPECLCTNKLVSGAGEALPAKIIFDGNNAVITVTANMVTTLLFNNPLIDIVLVGYGTNGLARVKDVQDIFTGQRADIPIITPAGAGRITYKLDPTVITDTTLPEVVDIIQAEACCGPQVAPGHVLIIPIANLRNRNAANPLQPKTSRRTLIQIEEYLKPRTSPFVQVHAKNASYEEIIVSFKVQFYSGIDKGFYIKKLNEEIVQFLTPWAFDENAEVKFNQKIYASSIINFIEERKYVDFITDFVMGVCCNDCCPPSNTTGNGILEGHVFEDDNEVSPRPLQGTIIKIKELTRTVTSAPDGTYQIKDIPAGTFTLIAYFSLFNIAKQSFAVDAQGKITQGESEITSIDFYRSAGNRQDDINEFFSNACGCNEIEWLLKTDPNFEGEIIAKPCTARSLLVSAPQHIIIPYEEQPQPSPCEERRKNQLTSGSRSSLPGSDTVNVVALERAMVKTSAASIKPATNIVAERMPVTKAIKKVKTAAIKKPSKKKPQ